VLGPSVVFVGTPVALVASLGTVFRAPDRPFAVAALALSVLESIGLIALLWLFLAPA
jgi:hypothetical protein